MNKAYSGCMAYLSALHAWVAYRPNTLIANVVGTTRPELSIGRLRDLRALFPQPAEQKQTTAILDAHDARIQAGEAYRNKLKFQKKGLKHDLLPGRVKVKVQFEDPFNC